MGLSSGANVALSIIGPPEPPTFPPTGGGGGGVGDGTTGGDSNTGGTVNSHDWYCPDINYANGDYMYPFDSTFITTPHSQWEPANNIGNLSWSIQVDSCLAHALAIALEILEYKKRGVQYQFSYGWIYGNRSSFVYMDDVNAEGLDATDGLNAMRDYGTCLYETLPRCWVYRKQNEPIYFPDVDWVNYPSPNLDQYTQVQNIYNSVTNERVHFRIGGWAYLGAMNTIAFKSYIQEYGCGLLWCYNGQDLWNAETNDGIVVYNSSNSTDVFSHVMCVRGWKTIAGKEYWICQNSWKDGKTGELVGHKGFFFVPFDYPRTINLIKLVPCYATSTTYAWENPKVAGQSASLLANEWNNLSDVLLAKLHNRAKATTPPLHYVKPGQLFTATLFNEVNSNLNQMISTGITNKVPGNPMTANDLNTLVTKLNSL